MKWRRAGWAALAWIVGLGLFVIAGRTALDGLWHGAPLIFLAGFVCLPPLRSFLARKTGVNLHGVIFGAACVGLVVLGANLGGTQQAKKQLLTEQAAQAASKKRVAEKRAAIESEFSQNRIAILVEARRLFDLGDHGGVAQYLGRFASIGDPDLARIREKSRAMLLRQELAGNPTQLRQAEIYTEVARLDPADTEAKAKAAELSEVIAVEKSRVAAELAKEPSRSSADISRAENNPDVRREAQAAIRLAGYACDSIDAVNRQLTRTGFRINCNGYRYTYTITDEGGRLVVRLD